MPESARKTGGKQWSPFGWHREHASLPPEAQSAWEEWHQNYYFGSWCWKLLRPCLVTRVVVVEFFASAGLTFFLVTFLLAGVALLGEVIQNNRGPAMLIQIAPYMLPPTLSYSLPIAILVATAQTLGRVAASQEITALLAGGIAPGLVIRPLLITALVTSATLAAIHEWAIPTLNRQLLRMLTRHATETMLSELSQGNTLRSTHRALLCRKVVEKTLISPVIVNYDDAGKLTSTMHAESASLAFNEDAQLTIILRNANVDLADGKQAHFESAELPLPDLKEGDAECYLRGQGMLASFVCPRNLETFSDLSRKAGQAAADLRRDPDSEWTESYRRTLDWAHGKWHYYVARCAAPLAFVAVAGPLALLLGKGGAIFVFLSVSAPVMLGYLYGLEIFRCMAERGLPLAVWTPSAVCGVLGFTWWLRVFYPTFRWGTGIFAHTRINIKP